MKQLMKVVSVSLFILLMTTACNKESVVTEDASLNNNEEVIKVMESVYADYINDMYLDRNKYIGKTIEVEGMFTILEEDNSNLYVYRLLDVMEHSHEEEHNHVHEHDEHNHECMEKKEIKAGFNFIYDGDLPKENDWIKVVGTLQEKDDDLVINAKSVEIMQDRGLEKVEELY